MKLLLVGLTLLAGFVGKNLTDDFLFRSNAKEFWALSAMLVGYGTRRARMLAAGEMPTEASPAAHAPADPARAAPTRARVELVDQ